LKVRASELARCARNDRI